MAAFEGFIGGKQGKLLRSTYNRTSERELQAEYMWYPLRHVIVILIMILINMHKQASLFIIYNNFKQRPRHTLELNRVTHA